MNGLVNSTSEIWHTRSPYDAIEHLWVSLQLAKWQSYLGVYMKLHISIYSETILYFERLVKSLSVSQSARFAILVYMQSAVCPATTTTCSIATCNEWLAAILRTHRINNTVYSHCISILDFSALVKTFNQSNKGSTPHKKFCLPMTL